MRASFDKDVTTCQEYCLFKIVRRVEFPLCLDAADNFAQTYYWRGKSFLVNPKLSL